MIKSINNKWCNPPVNFNLAEETFHLWRIHFPEFHAEIPALEKILSTEEQTRADRFYFQKDRGHFIIGRGLLRILIGKYLSMPPNRLEIVYSEFGKPGLTEGSNPGKIYFNLSNSGEWALIGFGHQPKIGVDLERIRKNVDHLKLAGRFFSANEARTLCLLPSEHQVEAFYSCWTRKEAYIKAVGKGLFLSLKNFEVSLAPDQTPALLSIAGDTCLAQEWTLLDLKVARDYKAALVVKGPVTRVKQFNTTSQLLPSNTA